MNPMRLYLNIKSKYSFKMNVIFIKYKINLFTSILKACEYSISHFAVNYLVTSLLIFRAEMGAEKWH